MPFAAALSEDPDTTAAVKEVLAKVLDQLGPEPDLALVFVTRSHGEALDEVSSAIRLALRPGVLLGAVAESVTGTAREVEGTAGVSLWAARAGPAFPVGMEVVGRDGPLDGWPDSLPFEPSALLLIGDPFSFPVQAFFEWLSARRPGLPVIGGMATGARGPGGSRLSVEGNVLHPAAAHDRIQRTGAVGAFLGSEWRVETVVSPGVRAIGPPAIVTRADHHIIYEMAGRPPLERLRALVGGGLSAADRDLIRGGGLQLGVVVDEHKASFGRGDFLILPVRAGDEANGAIVADDVVVTGQTVQFHLRDAASAEDELRAALAAKDADAALVFCGHRRGRALHGRPDGDAQVIAEVLGPLPTAGFFALGELAPLEGRNFIHGTTATLALFRESAPPR